MRKTILFVHQSADLYGSDRALLALVSGLDRTRFEAIVILPVDGPLVGELQNINIEYHVLPTARLSRATLSWAGLLRLPVELCRSILAYNNALKGKKVDVVHSNTLAVLSGAVWALLHRVFHIWHVHEIIVHPVAVRKVYAQLLYYLSDMVVCVSFAAKDNLIKDRALLAPKTQVVWNGVAERVSIGYQSVAQYRSQLGLDHDEVLVVLIGRINRLKGQEILVEAASILWEKGLRSIKFLLVGGVASGQSHFLMSLREKIELSPAKGNFTISSYSADIGTILEAADVVVIPSIEPESFGLVAVEAMIAKRPVIATKHGGVVEIVENGVTGALIPPNDASALAAELEFLASNPTTRHQMGERGYVRYKELFTVEHFVHGFEQLYKTVT